MTKVYDSDTQLMRDVICNNLTGVKQNLTSSTENQVDIEGNSILILTLYSDDIAIFEYVLNYYNQHNPKMINHQNNQKNTALMIAARNQDSNIVEMLIDAGADMLIKNSYNHNFIDLHMRGFKYKQQWLFDNYRIQHKILTREPSLMNNFINENVKLHSKIQEEFPHLISGSELNLL